MPGQKSNLYKTDTRYLFMFPDEKIPAHVYVCYPGKESILVADNARRQIEKELKTKIHIIKPGDLMFFVRASTLPSIQGDGEPNCTTLVISGERIGWVWASMTRFGIVPVEKE